MNFKKAFPIQAIILSIFMLSSCVAALKGSIKEDDKQIPVGFGKEEVTILVLRKGVRSYDKYLERNFEKYYTGNYEIIDRTEIDNKQYSNKNKYRYIFSEEKHVDYGNPARRTSIGEPATIYAMFGLLDRVTGKVYKTKHGTGAFAQWMKVYIQKLEKTRLKNMQN